MVTPYHTKCENNSVALLLGYNQVCFTQRYSISFPFIFHTLCPYLEASLVSWKRLDSKKFNLCMYILRTENQGGSKLMFMSFEIVYVYGFGTFSETCRSAAYSHLHK